MAVDFNAVASAIATRFSAANITPPSGQDDVRMATHELPTQIMATPAVLVFPPTSVTFGYGASLRKGSATFPVRWYFYKVKDTPRNAVLLNKWLGSLYQQLDGQVHLGLSTYVTKATIDAMRVGQLEYAGEAFEGIDMEVTVGLWEGLSAVA